MKKLLFLGALFLCFNLGNSFDIPYYIITGRISTPGNISIEGIRVSCIENPSLWDVTNEDGNYGLMVRSGYSVKIDESNYGVVDGPSVIGPIRGDSKWDIVMTPKFEVAVPENPYQVVDSLVQDVPDHFTAD